jgi:hypothetical protein
MMDAGARIIYLFIESFFLPFSKDDLSSLVSILKSESESKAPPLISSAFA